MRGSIMSEVVWLVRAGEDSRHARLFAVAARHRHRMAKHRGPRRPPGRAGETVLSLLRSSPTVSSAEADAAELLAFRDEMRIGDVVITPDATQRDVLDSSHVAVPLRIRSSAVFTELRRRRS
jgi:hypothetical protein